MRLVVPSLHYITAHGFEFIIISPNALAKQGMLIGQYRVTDSAIHLGVVYTIIVQWAQTLNCVLDGMVDGN